MEKRSELLVFYKDWYVFEHERHLKLNSSLSIVFAIQLTIATALYYLFDGFAIEFPFSISWLLFLSSCVFWVVSAFFAVRAYWGQQYTYLGNPRKLGNLYLNFIEWIEYRPTVSRKLAISEDLFERYVSCTEKNYNSNNEKSRFRHIAVGFLLASALTLGPSYVGFRLTKEVSYEQSQTTTSTSSPATSD